MNENVEIDGNGDGGDGNSFTDAWATKSNYCAFFVSFRKYNTNFTFEFREVEWIAELKYLVERIFFCCGNSHVSQNFVCAGAFAHI